MTTGRLALALALLVAPAAGAQRACEGAPPIAGDGYSAPLDVRLSLTVRDISLRDALDRLTALSGVQVAYSADVIPVDQRVCLVADRLPLGTALASLLRGLPVRAVVVAGRVVLTPASPQPVPIQPMARSVNVLERVVVTGSAVAAPRRPLAMSMEVIDGERLRQQGGSSLAEMLAAAVPGVWSWAQSPSSLIAQYGSIRGASSFGSSAPKIYIDGVEVANPLVVTQLNPESVDRIEVIRGPQGSALYGSDAISGVINVLTRHDGSTLASPSVHVRSVVGGARSAFATGLIPSHEQRLTVRAGTNVRSAGFALAFGQAGALVPSSKSRQLSLTGDARLVTASETLTMSLRVFDKTAGMGTNPLIAGLIPAPTVGGAMNPLAAAEPMQSVRQYTLSTSAAFATQGAWTHSVLAGVDGYVLNNVADAFGPISTALDSALRAARGNADRVTLRESSVARFDLGAHASGTMTVGVEHAILRQASTVTYRMPPRAGEQWPTAVDAMSETWNHNTGVLAQANVSWNDAIFTTGGLRVERNDNFTGSNRYPILPMLGLAAVRGFGDVQLKWRAAYGKGIRPPQTPARSASTGYAGNLGYQGAQGPASVAQALDPEVQSGYEGGLELYLGRTVSFHLTRFDQRATGLIQNVAVAIDTFARHETFERRVRYSPQNVGEITNVGWELQANLSRGALSLSTSLSSVDSRVRKLAPGYSADLREGDRMLGVPARTGSIAASYHWNEWFAALVATRALEWVNYDRLRLAQDFAAGGNGPNAFAGSRLRSYWRDYDGDTHLRFTTSRETSRGVSLLVSGENLLGGQLGEPDNLTIRPGRSVTAGLKASF